MRVSFNTYTLYARFFPAIISALPLFILWFFLSENLQLKELLTFLLSIKFYGGITISVVALYFFAQIIRITSKYFENKYFIRYLGFPTTYLMTYGDDTFSKSYKDKYRDLVKKHFDIDLLDEEREASDIAEAHKRLNESTKQVILKVGDGRLVRKQNVWYGFIRNLIGGSVFSMMFCLINVTVGLTMHRNVLLVILSVILLVAYGILFLFHKQIMKQNAEAYAKQLIAEFISLG